MKRALLLVICMIVVAQANWIKILGLAAEPQEPQSVVVDVDADGVLLRTFTFGFNITDTTVDEKNFQQLRIPGAEYIRDTCMAGKPQIPYIKLLIAIPDSCEIDVTPQLSDMAVCEDYLVYPVPKIVFTDSAGCIYVQEVYAYDTSFYQKDTLFPDIFYEVKKDGKWREQRVLEINVYPIQFNPWTKAVYCYNTIWLDIDYAGEKVQNTVGLGPFEELARDILLNYNGVDGPSGQRPVPGIHYYETLCNPSNTADYIIVSHDDFLINETGNYYINQFAQWRLDHNKFDIGIVSIRDVYEEFLAGANGDSAKSLLDFLNYAYSNWQAPGMPDNHFAYCLFIGDWNTVPIRKYWYAHNGDMWLGADEHYYVDLNGPYYSDIMLGRWPVKTISDVVTITMKTKNYEQPQFQLEDPWRRRGILAAGEWSFESFIDGKKWYIDVIGYDTVTIRRTVLSEQEWQDTMQHYLNHETKGVLLDCYSGHGGPDGWQNQYDTIDIKLLTNYNRLPVVLSAACLTAMFQWDYPGSAPPNYPPSTSFAEHFLFNPNGGAVAFWGSPRYSSLFEYDFMFKPLFIYQNWILGKFIYLAGPPADWCLLGDPALDLGDFSAHPNYPDLVARPYHPDLKDITIPTEHPYHNGGSTIPIRVKILNIGGTVANDVAVEINVSLHSDIVFSETAYITEILPRDSAIVNIFWNTNITHPNKYGLIADTIKVRVDPQNVITESWEENNDSYKPEQIALYPNAVNWPKHFALSIIHEPALANVEIDEGGLITTVPVIAFPAENHVFVFTADGNNFQNWPQYFPDVKSIVIGDVNNDTKPEIAAISETEIRLYQWDGVHLWTQGAPPDYYFDGFPALGYVDGPNTDELQVIVYMKIKATGMSVSAKILVFDSDGSLYKTFITSGAPQGTLDYIKSLGPSIADINDDGLNEVIVSYEYETPDPPGRPLFIYTDVFNDNNTSPLYTVTNLGSNHMVSALVDVNSDYVPDIITGCRDGYMKAHFYESGDLTELWATLTNGPICSSPVVGNIHRTIPGNEVAFGNNANEIHLLRAGNGYQIDPFPRYANDSILTSPALARLEGWRDRDEDIIIGCHDQFVYAYNYFGDPIDSFPLPLHGKPSSAVVGNIDGDMNSETILFSSDGYLHVWKNLKSIRPLYNLEWPQFHHDCQRTGLYGWVGGLMSGGINPAEFSATTTVSLVCNKNLKAQIRVHDESGNIVRNIVNRVIPAGASQYIWNGKNDKNELLADGLYFVEIKIKGDSKILPVTIKR